MHTKPSNKCKAIPLKYALFNTKILPFLKLNEENNDFEWREQGAHNS